MGVMVGRDAELAVVVDAMERANWNIPSVVWIEGEAGVGKTTLVEHAIQAFRSSGAPETRTVWRVTGDAEEQVVEHGIADHLLVLSGATRGLGAAAGSVPDPGVSAAQLLHRLNGATADGTVLLVLDDAHWFDHCSRQVLRFLFRRLGELRVLGIVAHRPMGPWPADVRRASRGLATVEMSLDPLQVGDVRLLMDRRGIPLTPRAARRLHEHTAGSPQLIQALADELSPTVLASGDGQLPAPRSFVEVTRGTFAAATPPVRAVVAAVAVLGRAVKLSQVSAVAGIDRPERPVDEAIRVHLLRLVTRGGERLVDVDHALVRSAVNEELGFTEFSDLHSRAAALAQDPVRAMLHRLRANRANDPGLPDEAAELAEAQAAEGAALASARILALLGDVIAPGQRRRDVLVTAAERLLTVGEVRWAEELLARVTDERSGRPAAHELLVRGQLALHLGRPDVARAAAEDAWELGRDPRVVTGAAELLAYLDMDAGDGVSATVWATRAIDAADTRLVALQLAGTVLASGWALRGDIRPARELLRMHSGRLAGTASEPDIRLGLALTELWTGNLAAAEVNLARLQRVIADGPAVLRSASRLAQAELDYRRGRWDAVLEVTDSELASLDEGWETRTAPMTLAVGAYVCAGRGQRQRALALIERAEGLLDTEANLPSRIMVALARGRLALSDGDSATAISVLEPLLLHTDTRSIPEGVHSWRSDLAEALIAADLLDAADDLLADPGPVEDDPHAWARVQRVRGALAMSRGNHDAAMRHLEEAVAAGPEVSGSVAHAHAELTLGGLLRRRGQRRAAAEWLEPAEVLLTQLGAAPLLGMVRQELALCGRRATQQPAGGLTPAEKAVARLVVAGQSNREIAQTLTLSIKTVETHLGRIFTKLQVRRRVELVNLLTAQRGSDRPKGR